jgi:hypothetical protein
MKIKTIAATIASIACMATSAKADYHTVLTGVRLHLSTTTISLRVSFSTGTENGITQVVSAQGPLSFEMPSPTVEGYLATLSSDPPILIGTSGLHMKGEAVLFYFAPELVRLKYPRALLANTQTAQGIFIPRNVITAVENVELPFNGDQGMGEPFFVPDWEARLMSTRPPHFSCAPPIEQRNLEFISYNETVGEKDLSQFCQNENYDLAAFGALAKKQNVFAIFYPAD